MTQSIADLKFLRFSQRLSNLNGSFSFLHEAMNSQAEERIKNAAIIKAFEMAFELCWKSLMDLLEYKGISVATPRDVIKEAFKAGYLEDGQAWMDLLDQRNKLVHVYNEDQSLKAALEIKNTAISIIQTLVTLLNNVQSDGK
jgi:nucleotidyltransferase substrate binding protein (TIGR01987 family)